MKVPKSVIKIIESSNGILAHAHASPDPDCLGSVLALKLGLESIGKKVDLFCEDVIPTNTVFLPGSKDIEHLTLPLAVKRDFDLYLAVDTAVWHLASKFPKPEINKPVLNIDHHPDNQMNGKVNWVEPKASCAAEMIYFLLKELDIEITPQIATCLLFSILGETSVFQNSNTTTNAMIIAARLKKLGGDYNDCVTKLIRSYTPPDLLIWGKLLSNLKYDEKYGFAWFTLNPDEWSSLNPRNGVGELANLFANRLAKTKFGCILVEKRPGLTGGSLRSRKSDFDVSDIAHRLGGGGHKATASFRIDKPLAQAEKDFLAVARKVLKEVK